MPITFWHRLKMFFGNYLWIYVDSSYSYGDMPIRGNVIGFVHGTLDFRFLFRGIIKSNNVSQHVRMKSSWKKS